VFGTGELVSSRLEPGSPLAASRASDPVALGRLLQKVV